MRKGGQVVSSVEQRITDRIIVSQKVDIISGKKITQASIENISEQGLYMIIPNTGKDLIFKSGTIHELRFKPRNGEPFNVPCNVQWSYKTPPHGLTSSMGMEVLRKTPEYKQFLKSLLIDIINPSHKYREMFNTLT
jgi:hypothetical protein